MQSSLLSINPQALNTLFAYLANDPSIITWIASTDFLRQIYLSNSFEILTGWPQQKMYEDMTLWRRILIPQDQESAINELFIQEHNKEYCKVMRYRSFTASGEILHLKDHHFPLHDHQGQLVAYGGYCNIISPEAWHQPHSTNPTNHIHPIKSFYEILKSEFNLKNGHHAQNNTHLSNNDTSPYTLCIKDYRIKLTLREAQTLFYLVQGYSTKIIARKLHISPRTVEIHIANIRNKTNTITRVELLTKISNLREITLWF